VARLSVLVRAVLSLLWLVLGCCKAAARGLTLGCCDVVAATYNIWNYNNYWSVRKLRIAEVIRNSQLDIVGLQVSLPCPACRSDQGSV
jgi:hypothetical protein